MTFKISSFSTYLTKSVKQLESLKEQVKVVANAKKAIYRLIQYYFNFYVDNMTQALVPGL